MPSFGVGFKTNFETSSSSIPIKVDVGVYNNGNSARGQFVRKDGQNSFDVKASGSQETPVGNVDLGATVAIDQDGITASGAADAATRATPVGQATGGVEGNVTRNGKSGDVTGSKRGGTAITFDPLVINVSRTPLGSAILPMESMSQ